MQRKMFPIKEEKTANESGHNAMEDVSESSEKKEYTTKSRFYAIKDVSNSVNEEKATTESDCKALEDNLVSNLVEEQEFQLEVKFNNPLLSGGVAIQVLFEERSRKR